MRLAATMTAWVVALDLCAGFADPLAAGDAEPAGAAQPREAVVLPEPQRDGAVSVERALALRRSVREFSAEPLSLDAAAQILWAAQGITDPAGHRTAPSAGALYPLEVYLVAGAVSGIASGTYRYEPEGHRLLPLAEGDARRRIARAALEQDWVADAPAILVLGAVHERSARKYGRRAPRYVHMEVGHAAQNVYLQAFALDLGTCMVGAFHDARLKDALDLPDDVELLGLMPVGRPR